MEFFGLGQFHFSGYEFHLPFLDKSCGVNEEEKHIIRPLYKLLFNINHPTMGFIGFVKETLLFPLVDLQVRMTKIQDIDISKITDSAFIFGVCFILKGYEFSN